VRVLSNLGRVVIGQHEGAEVSVTHDFDQGGQRRSGQVEEALALDRHLRLMLQILLKCVGSVEARGRGADEQLGLVHIRNQRTGEAGNPRVVFEPTRSLYSRMVRLEICQGNCRSSIRLRGLSPAFVQGRTPGPS